MTLLFFIYFNAFCEFSISTYSEERYQAATVLAAMASRKELCLVPGDHAFISKHLLLL